MTAHIGSPGRRRERSIDETGGPDLEGCLFDVGTPDDKDNGRELAETLLDCIL